MVTVTGLDVTSLVVPATVTEALLVISPSVGLVTFKDGATVSTVKDVLFSAESFPSLSAAFTATVLISTHLIADVERVLDEYLFLSQGRILQGGNVDAVREETGKSLDELFREVFKCLPNC